jgi:hypothetical protein
MSLDDTIAHLRDQLATGSVRRRRYEQRRRVVAIGAFGLVLAVSAGFVAVGRDGNDSVVVGTTAMTEAQRAVCDAYLDYATAPFAGPFQGDPPTDPFAAAVVELAQELPANDPLAAARGLTPPDGPGHAEAINALTFGCRDLGHPDFNPVYVPASVPDPAPPVDLISPDANAQNFRGVSDAPLGFVRPGRVGHRMSAVRVAVTNVGAYVAAWDFTGADGRRIYCSSTGWPRQRAGDGCGTGVPPVTVVAPLHIQVLTDRSTNPSPGAVIATSAEVATVVVSHRGQTVVQQPVLNRAVIVWREPTGEPITIRAYDSAGQLLVCRSDRGGQC